MQKFCTECGQPAGENVKFCPACGFKLLEADPASSQEESVFNYNRITVDGNVTTRWIEELRCSAQTITIDSLPMSLGEFVTMPEAALKTPFQTPLMLVIALANYKDNRDIAFAMINHLRGPQPLTQREIGFINDRMAQNGKAAFIAESYFNGAKPENDYTPDRPYSMTISESPYSYDGKGYAKLFIASGDADSPRAVTSRQAKDGKWYLWEFSSVLSDIRAPESTTPWVQSNP